MIHLQAQRHWLWFLSVVGDFAFLLNESLCALTLHWPACAKPFNLLMVRSVPEETSMDMELRQIISRLHDRDEYVTDDTGVWEFMGSDNDDEKRRNEEKIYEANETLHKLGHNVFAVLSAPNSGSSEE